MERRVGLYYDEILCTDREEWLEARKPLLTASDIGAALGHSPYKTPTELWEEKTGLRPAKDISDRPQVKRGIEREPVIRQAFIDRNPWAEVSYDPITIYLSNRKGYEMIGATLDGAFVVRSEDNPYHWPVGWRGVLEIKSVGVREPSDASAWAHGGEPQHYRDQVLQQMAVRAADCALLLPEFAQELKDGSTEYHLDSPRPYVWTEVREEAIANMREAQDWWFSYVLTKTPPPTVMGQNIREEDMTEETAKAVLVADVEVGTFHQNFAQITQDVEAMVEPYRDAVFTAETVKDAKEIHAKLASLEKDVDDKRKAVKKKYEEPLKRFEEEAKKLTAIIAQVRLPIKAQIDGFEERRKAEKREKVETYILDIMVSTLDDVQSQLYRSCGGVVFDDRWLNKSMSMEQIGKAVEEQIEAYLNDFTILDSLSSDAQIRSQLFNAYAMSRDIAKVVQTKAQIEERNRLMEIERERRELERKQKMLEAEELKAAEERLMKEREAEAQRQAVIDTKIEHVMPEVVEKPQTISYTFRAEHADKKAWLGLINYMKNNGFRFEKLN